MNMATAITVDPEFQSLIPPLTDEEFRQLEQAILRDGIRAPLVTWQKILLDGHHRKRIIDKHNGLNIDYQTVEVALPNRDSAKAWIIKNQFARRNLSPYQRAELAFSLEKLLPSRQGQRTDLAGNDSGVNSHQSKPSEIAAKTAGISAQTFSRAKCLRDNADDSAKEKLRRGETTINREYKRIVQAERKLAQAEAAKTAKLPQGKYQVIAADPPWQYRKRPDDVTQRGRCPYPTMTVDEIAALPVSDLAHEDCILWLWTTNSHMAEAHQVAKDWGFTVKTILTWVKNKMGVGDWLRGQTEHCLMCVKGKPVVNLTDQTTVLHGALREHSRKPEEFFKLVEALCPAKARLELFSRAPREGWTAHGSEKNEFDGTI